MKKTFVYIFSFVAVLFTACDIVPENERLIEVESLPQQRVVLLEDYTGQKCVNCPNATKEVHNLQKIFGKNLVVVAIHSGSFSLPKFRTQAGNEYTKKFQIASYPTGLINRKSYNGSKQIEYSQWANAIRQLVKQKSGIEIEVKKEWKAETLNIFTKVKRATEFVNKELALQIWIVENNIKAIQLMPDGSKNRDYIHNHVLRGAVNGTWGTTLDFDKTNIATSSDNYRFENKNIIVENCDIIAFVYNKNNDEILEATKIKVEEPVK